MPATNVNWPTPLTRLNPWYPGTFGVPGTDHDRGLRLDCNGLIFYVDPNHVDPHDQRDGTNPEAPLATVAEALTQCRPYRGDVIAVMHNGYWTYGDPTEDNFTPIAETVTVSVPGVRIVGVAPSGSLGVPWVPTANNDVLITVNAMDVLIEGFCFWNADGYTGTTGILAEWDGPPWGENVTIRNNFFYTMAYGVQLDYSWNGFIENNYFQGCTTAAIHNPSVYGEPDYFTIRNNVFTSNAADINLPDCDNQLIEGNRFMDLTLAVVILNGDDNTIHGNTFQGDPTGTNNYINLTGGGNNLVSDNYLACTIAQFDVTCSDATSGSWVNNHLTNGPNTAPPV
jgi:hypothetical protein